MDEMERVIVVDRFTRSEWLRRVGDGPWEKVDCSLYPDGKPPVVFFNDTGGWVELQSHEMRPKDGKEPR